MMYPLTQAFITRGRGYLYRSLRLPSHVVRHLVRHRDAWVVPWFDPRAQSCSRWPWHSCGSATQLERSGSTCCAKLKGVTTNTTRDLHRLGSITLLQATATYRCIREHSILRSRRRTQGYSRYDSSAERLWCGQQVSDDHDTGCGAQTHSSRSAWGSPNTISTTLPAGDREVAEFTLFLETCPSYILGSPNFGLHRSLIFKVLISPKTHAMKNLTSI